MRSRNKLLKHSSCLPVHLDSSLVFLDWKNPGVPGMTGAEGHLLPQMLQFHAGLETCDSSDLFKIAKQVLGHHQVQI